MENIQDNIKKDYIKALLLLLFQMKEMEELKQKPIEDIKKNCWKCFLINKDIIDNYKQIYLYTSISKIADKYYQNKNKTVDEISQMFIKKVGVDTDKFNIFEENIIPALFEPEKIKIQNFDYPYNFFILREDVKNLLFKKQIQNKEIEDNIFIPFNLLIGKEGIFMWNSNKQNKKIVIYFMENCQCEISKIFIYEEESEFLDELTKNIKGKTPKQYFKFRNINNRETGFFNLIDDGNIICKYLNIKRSNISEDDEIDKETEDTQSKFQKVITNIDKNKKLIENFLKCFLINLYYIKEFRENCKGLSFENKRNNLLYEFSLFVEKFAKDNSNKYEKETKNFIEVFFNKKLGEAITFNEDYESSTYEKIIKNVIKTFLSELKIKEENNYNKDTLNYTKIKKEELKMNISKEKLTIITESFKILYINVKKFIVSEFKLNDVSFEIKPRIIISILDKSIKDYLEQSKGRNSIFKLSNNNSHNNSNDPQESIDIPLKIEVDHVNYSLLSSILKVKNSNEFLPIIIKDKRIFYEKGKYTPGNILFEDGLNHSTILFYEMIEEFYTSSNNIYDNSSLKNLSNSYSPVYNETGYHDNNNMKVENMNKSVNQ